MRGSAFDPRCTIQCGTVFLYGLKVAFRIEESFCKTWKHVLASIRPARHDNVNGAPRSYVAYRFLPYRSLSSLNCWLRAFPGIMDMAQNPTGDKGRLSGLGWWGLSDEIFTYIASAPSTSPASPILFLHRNLLFYFSLTPSFSLTYRCLIQHKYLQDGRPK